MNHAGVSRLREALRRDLKSVCSGVCSLAEGKTILFYGKDSDTRQVIRIDLNNASSSELEHLSLACDVATFGRGQKDVLDESYRKAGKMDLEHFSCTFDLLESRIMDAVRPFIIQGESESSMTVRPELYKLNVYDKGAFFKAHKDTPRAENMVASLVVVFATPHEGGALVLRHGNKEWVYDSGNELSFATGPQVGYVAFFSDVEHEVLPVTSGHRVTLTYNIYLEKQSSNAIAAPVVSRGPIPKSSPDIKNAFHALLSDPSFLPKGGLIGFGLCHQYPFQERLEQKNNWWQIGLHAKRAALQNILNILKGGDRALYNLCKELGLNAYLRVVYESDGSGEALLMSDHVPEGGNGRDGWSYIDDTLVEREGAFWVRTDNRFRDDIHVPDEHEVRWITDMTLYNKTVVPFIAYGNEASLVWLYGDFCLICSVGPANNRTAGA